MGWTLDKNRPICPQIYENICVKIAKGEYKPNDRIQSVREIAVDAGVNPNTVQKALAILEENGLVYSLRGSGIYVADNADVAKKIIEQIKLNKIASFFDEMSSLGLCGEEIKRSVELFLIEKGVD